MSIGKEGENRGGTHTNGNKGAGVVPSVVVLDQAAQLGARVQCEVYRIRTCPETGVSSMAQLDWIPLTRPLSVFQPTL